MMTAMILVGQYDSPLTRRVAISMHLLGVAFERDTRSVFADAEAMRAINPLGRIPALVLDDGEILIESGAIHEFLDEQAGPSRALVAAAGAERRHALQRIALATGVLDKAGATVYERTLRPPERRHAPWVDRCRVQAESGLAALERATGDGWFGSGDRPLQPDLTAGCVIDYLLARAPELFPAGRYPRLAQLHARVEALPAFRATRPAVDEVMPDGL